MSHFPIEIHAPYDCLKCHKGKSSIKVKDWEIPIREDAKRHLETMSDEALDTDWKLNEFFGTIAIINLPEAKERLALTTYELNQIGIKNFTVFPAINGRKELDHKIWGKFHTNRDQIQIFTHEDQKRLDRVHQGEAGCYMSHLNLLRKTKEAFEKAKNNLVRVRKTGVKKDIQQAVRNLRKYSRLLVLEDDCGFGVLTKDKRVITKGVGRILREALLDLPDDWDMVYFFVIRREASKKVASHLHRIKKSDCTIAIAVNYKMYQPLITQLEKIENESVSSVLPVDNEIASLHHRYKVYAIFPPIVYQQPGKSQISEKNWDVSRQNF